MRKVFISKKFEWHNFVIIFTEWSEMLFFCLLFLRTLLATVGTPALSTGAESST